MIDIKLDHALVIRSTNSYNVIAAQRQQAHGDIIGDGELSLMLDDLVVLLERIGLKSEEVVNGLRATVDTQQDMPLVTVDDTREFPPIIVYGPDGKEMAS